MKTVEDLLLLLGDEVEKSRIADKSLAIKSISNNSRKVRPGYVFVAINGFAKDGHDYVDSAISGGAHTIIHEESLARYEGNVNYIRVKNSYQAYSSAVELFFDYPAKNLTLTGITGTNGKTTVAFICEQILSFAKIKTGMITTVKYTSATTEISANRTTPEAYELQRLFSQMVEDGCSSAVMEVSSHALDQRRIGSTVFEVGIFTNLTGDHLDYHLTKENYYLAKRKLFSEHLAADSKMIVNIDDIYGRRLLEDVTGPQKITYGFAANADYRITDLKMNSSSISFLLNNNDRQYKVVTNLIGRHNALNITAAIINALQYGVKLETAIKALKNKIVVPGRLEHYILPCGAEVYVDYAHTDDALSNVLKTIKDLYPKRIIALFGCGGNRDKSKRPLMGRVAAELADRVILTSDNPRNEEPDKIIEDIASGIPEGTDFLEIPERQSAIKAAVNQCQKGDILLIAGKGHETYQQIGDEKIFFDDRKIVEELCR